MAKKTVITVLLTVTAILLFALCGCTVQDYQKLIEDVNRYDDIYELENGEFLFMDAGVVGSYPSLKSKEKTVIAGFTPEVVELNPHVIGEYLYISQDLSDKGEYKTKVTKIELDGMKIVEEREYEFAFDCMTSDGEKLIYMLCKDADSDNCGYSINTELKESKIKIDGRIALSAESEEEKVLPFEISEIYSMQFKGNKGILTVGIERDDYMDARICTAVIEDNELILCKNFNVVEPNAQIISTDYDSKLTIGYNSMSTDTESLKFNYMLQIAQIEQDDLFTATKLSEYVGKLDYQNYLMNVVDDESIYLLSEAVGEVENAPDGYGKFIVRDGNTYFVRASLTRGATVYKKNSGTGSVKFTSRTVRYKIYGGGEDLKTTIIDAGNDEIYFHISRCTGNLQEQKYLISGFIDISGVWV